MSAALLNLSYKQKDLTASEKSILCRLAWHANSKNLAWPSIASLHQDTSVSEKTIKNSLKSLIAKNLIIKSGAYRGSTKQIPVYIINLKEG